MNISINVIIYFMMFVSRSSRCWLLFHLIFNLEDHFVCFSFGVSCIVYGFLKQDPLDVSSKTFVIDSFYYKFLIFRLVRSSICGRADSSFMIRGELRWCFKNIPPHISADIKANGFFALHKYSKFHFPRTSKRDFLKFMPRFLMHLWCLF